jgi:hypothetical protein
LGKDSREAHGVPVIAWQQANAAELMKPKENKLWSYGLSTTNVKAMIQFER